MGNTAPAGRHAVSLPPVMQGWCCWVVKLHSAVAGAVRPQCGAAPCPGRPCYRPCMAFLLMARAARGLLLGGESEAPRPSLCSHLLSLFSSHLTPHLILLQTNALKEESILGAVLLSARDLRKLLHSCFRSWIG